MLEEPFLPLEKYARVYEDTWYGPITTRTFPVWVSSKNVLAITSDLSQFDTDPEHLLVELIECARWVFALRQLDRAQVLSFGALIRT